MKHEQIYRKVGKRYKPVGICQEPNWYPPGCSLVVVDKGCTSIQYQRVTPSAAPLLAALRLCRDKVDDAVRQAHAARSGNAPSKRMTRAWEILRRELPGDLIMVSWPSVREITDAMERELVRLVEADK